ncbi:MAG: hypothetical protein ACOYYU_19765 [Chloroflexota bacterium]
MSWSNKKAWLVLLGGIVLILAIVLVLMVSGPVIPGKMCTLVGCVGGVNVEVTGLPESTPFEVSLIFPSGERQSLECSGKAEESVPFEGTCSSTGAFFGLPPDAEPPTEITVEITTSSRVWTEIVHPEYEIHQPNGDGCPPVCYNADIVISIEP